MKSTASTAQTSGSRDLHLAYAEPLNSLTAGKRAVRDTSWYSSHLRDEAI